MMFAGPDRLSIGGGRVTRLGCLRVGPWPGDSLVKVVAGSF